MTFRLWYQNAQNNGGKGYAVEHDTLKEFIDAEGHTSYVFECAELKVKGAVHGGMLIGINK